MGGFDAVSKEQLEKFYQAAKGKLKKVPASAYGAYLPAGQKP